MAKIKLQPEASSSNVFTIATPAGSGDYTINLPAATGTLLTTDGDGSSLTGVSSVGGATGVDFNDNVKAQFGASDDLQIYHDGSHSYISEQGTGRLILKTDYLEVQNAAGNEAILGGIEDGATSLFYNGQTKLATTSTGVDVTGDVTASGSFLVTGDVAAGDDAGIGYNSTQGLILTGQGSSEDVTIKNDANSKVFSIPTGTTTSVFEGSIYCPTSTASSGAKYGFGTSSPTGKVHVKYDGWNGSDGIQMEDMYGGSYNCIAIDFNRNGSRVGTIQTYLTSTAYNTSSDYRLKEDVKPMSASIDKLKELKPVNFAWKVDGSRVDGFLAHEAQEVVPEAITGTKDAMRTEEYEVEPAIEATYDEEGNELTPAVEAVMGEREVEDYQGIDQSKLVPLLTSALQEAVAKIEELTTRIEILEAK